MEALQRLHMSPVGPHSPFMSHHESMIRANVESGAAAGDRKSPMDHRLVMQVRSEVISEVISESHPEILASQPSQGLNFISNKIPY